MLSISFYDGVKYHRQDFMNRDSDFFGNGVLQLTHFPYSLDTPADMKINIGAGVAWVDGYRIQNDSNAISLTVPAADSTNPRIDIVQIGHDDINSQAVLTIKTGVAASSPTEPSADPNNVKLYAINVPANATSITASNITDRRVLVPLNVSATQIVSGGSAGTGQANNFTQTQTFSDAPAPINIPGLTQLPAVAAKDTMCVVNNMWYRSDGTQWIAMAPPATGNATSSIAGLVEVVETPASGVPVTPTRCASFQETQITGTSAQTVLTYTPQANHNFELNLSFRVVTATTTVTIQVTYKDAGGNETYYVLNNQSCAVGNYSCVPFAFNAQTGAAITVTITAGTANQVYASGALKAV